MNSFKPFFLFCKFSLCMFVALAISAASCGDDDEDPHPVEDPIVGTWVLTKAKLTECNDASLNATFPMQCTAQDCTTIQFNADGTLRSVVKDPDAATPERTVNGTYTLSAAEINICFNISESSQCEERIFHSLLKV